MRAPENLESQEKLLLSDWAATETMARIQSRGLHLLYLFLGHTSTLGHSLASLGEWLLKLFFFPPQMHGSYSRPTKLEFQEVGSRH